MNDNHEIQIAGMSRQQKRQRRLRLWQNVPASLQLLRYMADEGGITSQHGAAHLKCALQTARNALGKLVRQGRATVVRGTTKTDFAVYTVTPKGCAALDAIEGAVDLSEADEDERECLLAAQEADDQRARIEVNMDRARRIVPRSVFDLGRCIAVGAQA